jgi:hypothetical protein
VLSGESYTITVGQGGPGGLKGGKSTAGESGSPGTNSVFYHPSGVNIVALAGQGGGGGGKDIRNPDPGLGGEGKTWGLPAGIDMRRETPGIGGSNRSPYAPHGQGGQGGSGGIYKYGGAVGSSGARGHSGYAVVHWYGLQEISL